MLSSQSNISITFLSQHLQDPRPELTCLTTQLISKQHRWYRTMLLKLLLALTALTIAVQGMAVLPSITSTSPHSPHKRTHLDHDPTLHIPNPDNRRNTYTTEEMKKFLQGHLDALRMCQTVLDEALKTAKQKEESNFDKILKHYFAAEDRQTVISQYSPSPNIC